MVDSKQCIFVRLQGWCFLENANRVFRSWRELAFLYNWYDTSILYLLEAHNVLIKQKDRLEELKAVKELLTIVVFYHNAKLSKYGSSIGADWKSFDYQVQLGIRPSITTISRTSYNTLM